MSGQRPGNDFEERLLARLKAVVADRGAEAARLEGEEPPTAVPAWRRRGPRLALGGGIALALVATALAINAGGDSSSKAFAVEPQDGGGSTIRIYSLKEAAALEETLESAGIPAQVTWLPIGMACREPHYTPSTVSLPGGGTLGGMSMEGPGPNLMTFGVGDTQEWREASGKRLRGEISEEEMRETVPNLNLDPEAFGPGQSVVLSGTPVPYDGDPEGGFEAKFDIAEGPVDPCRPVPYQPTHESILRPPPGGWRGADDVPSGG